MSSIKIGLDVIINGIVRGEESTVLFIDPKAKIDPNRIGCHTKGSDPTFNSDYSTHSRSEKISKNCNSPGIFSGSVFGRIFSKIWKKITKCNSP